jgi:hypothetical protein
MHKLNAISLISETWLGQRKLTVKNKSKTANQFLKRTSQPLSFQLVYRVCILNLRPHNGCPDNGRASSHGPFFDSCVGPLCDWRDFWTGERPDIRRGKFQLDVNINIEWPRGDVAACKPGFLPIACLEMENH